MCIKYECAFGGNTEEVFDETLTILTQLLLFVSKNKKNRKS